MNQEELNRFFLFWERRIAECKSIDELKQAAENHKIAKNMGLAVILKKFLPEGVTSLDQVDVVQLREAVEAFIKEQMAQPHKEVDADWQMKFFLHLLDGTSDKDKVRLYKAFVKVAAENQQVSKMLDMMILSIAKSEDVQKFLNQIPIETFETLGLSKEEVLKTMKLLAQSGDLKYVEKVKEELKEKLEKFYNQNNETIKSIKQKIQAKQKELGRELADEEIFELFQDSPEELKLIKAFANIKALCGGFSLGTILNNNISQQDKTNTLSDLLAKVKEYGYSEDVFNEIKKYIGEHPEEFEGNLKNVTEILNTATGGEFGEIPASNTQAKENSTASATDDSGFIVPQSDNLESHIKSIEDKRAEIMKNCSDNEKNSVENNNNRSSSQVLSMAGMTANSLIGGIQSGVFKSITDAVQSAVKNYENLAESGKTWCITTLSNMSKTVANYILSSGISGSALVDLARNGIDVDIKRISTNYDTKRQLEQEQA